MLKDECVTEQKPTSSRVNNMKNSHGNISSSLHGEIFICICNMGMMMKRKGGLPRGDQKKLIKFNWMSTFTNSNVCFSYFTEITTQKWTSENTWREKRFVNTTGCKNKKN